MSRTIKKPYTKSKNFDKTCRSHGGCPYCYSNRLIHTLKELDRTNLKYDISTPDSLESINAYSKTSTIFFEDWDTYKWYYEYNNGRLHQIY